MTSKNIKISIIALLVALVVFIAFTYLKGDDSSDAVLQSFNKNEEIGKDIIMELNKLNSIRLDEDIFKSTLFFSFQDFTLEVREEKIGRNNPFSPFAGLQKAPLSGTIVP